MLNVVPISLIMGVVFKKCMWLEKFPQTEPPLKNHAYAPVYAAHLAHFCLISKSPPSQ